jgi:hypothetical protein
MDPTEAAEATQEITGGNEGDRFNRLVAVTVALVAVFMALCNIKDGNLCQAMEAAKAHELDQWNFYQAKSIKQQIARLQVNQFETQLAVGAGRLLPEAAKRLQDDRAAAAGEVDRYDREKEEIKTEAESARAEWEALGFRDDQFDLSEALLGLAITLFALCALTRSRGLYVGGLLLAAVGALMGLAGFLGWDIHPGVIKFLT